MDGWLKFLIATACVVVILGGGYYAIKEWREADRIKDIQQRSASQDAEQQKRVNDTDFIKCRNSLNSSALGEAKRLRDWCRQNNYITYAEQLKVEGIGQ